VSVKDISVYERVQAFVGLHGMMALYRDIYQQPPLQTTQRKDHHHVAIHVSRKPFVHLGISFFGIIECRPRVSSNGLYRSGFSLLFHHPPMFFGA
jgi:hypothetical protein